MVTLAFSSGTIEVRGLDDASVLPDAFRHDPRSQSYRAPAFAYAEAIRALHGAGIDHDDRARAYVEIGPARIHREARPYQTAALDAWKSAKGRGCIVLPTGAGKSHVGVMAMDDKRRSTLVVAPTLDLVRQWYDLLRTTFGGPVGIVGGGHHEVQAITVTTYDSAHLHMENFGARFGLVIFDECHHLPAEAYSLAARLCLAPFRLGLSATPERVDGKDQLLAELVGPIVHREEIRELSGEYLSEYETERVSVELSPSEREEYDRERAVYLSFLREARIAISAPRGWEQFVMRSAQSERGRRAMQAYGRQRDAAFSASAKLDYVDYLLERHGKDRMIVFTNDNRTAYRVSRRYLVPAITHQTKLKERSEILTSFASGEYGAVVTSRVLNEGVDVPEANVAVVLSGTGSVREHVQRLGRILRPREGKRAVLYEVITANTAEAFTSQRRREHDAYR